MSSTEKSSDRGLMHKIGQRVAAIPTMAKTVGYKVLCSLYEGTTGNWFQHGATELANMVLHGHAAPVYSRSLSSPAETASQEMQVSTAQQISAPENSTAPNVQAATVEASVPQVTAHGSPANTPLQPLAPIQESSGVEASAAQPGKGIIAECMEKLASYEPQLSQDQELSR